DGGAGGAGVDHPGHPIVRREGDADHLSPALRDERPRRRGVGHLPGALHVQLDHRPKPLRGDRLGRAQELAAGVVDEDVEATETAQTWPASRPGAKIREGAGSPIAAATIAAVPAPCRRYADRSVKVHAEPKPLTEPLAGGRDGATVVVEPLKAGEMQAPRAF